MHRIESETFYLRVLTEADITDEYIGWINDPATNRFLESRHEYQTEALCRSHIRKSAKNGDVFWGIFDNKSHKHIGNIKLSNINVRYRRAVLSLVVGKSQFRGVGLGTTAIGLVTEFGFKKLGLHKIEAGVYETNTPSLRAFRKNDYNICGFFPDHAEDHENRMIGSFWLCRLNQKISTP